LLAHIQATPQRLLRLQIFDSVARVFISDVMGHERLFASSLVCLALNSMYVPDAHARMNRLNAEM
jgi:hypothetical protein